MTDIAKVAGVSVTTVSLALRNDDRISQKTRQRIQQIAEDLHYEPDPSLASLNAYRRIKFRPKFSGTIAFLNNLDYSLKADTNPNISKYFSGAVQRAQQLGYVLEEIEVRSKRYSAERLRQVIETRNCRSIIIGPWPATGQQFELDISGFSCIAIGFSLKYPQLHRVASHYFQSMSLMVTRLVDMGYRRPGLVITRQQDLHFSLRVTGAFLAVVRYVSENRVPLRESILYSTDLHAFSNWLKEFEPDVVISLTPDVIKWFHTLKVPSEEIGYALTFPFRTYPEVAHIDEIPMDIGMAAIDLVTSMTYHNERGIPDHPHTTLLDGCFIEGNTVHDKRGISTSKG